MSTPEHMHFAGYVLGRTPQLHMTYLMWKQGVGFRVGTSLSDYDEAWVVGTHANPAEAEAHVADLAERYALPTSYSELDTEKSGYMLLADEDLSFDYPHHAAHGHTNAASGSPRRRLSVVLCGDRRGESPFHRISLFGYDDEGRRPSSRWD